MTSLAEPRPRTPRSWWPAAALVFFVAAYSLRYVVLGERAYVPELAASFRARSALVATHTLFGPVALVLGLFNLLPAIRPPTRRRVHRNLGRVYLAATIMLGTAGLALSVHAAGGLVSRLGFFVLALITVGSACTGYWSIRHGNIERHREWMTRSYACIFGAVTLRLWLPLLIVAHGGEFLPAYRWVAWLAWVPNLAFAEWTIRRARTRRIAPTVEQGSPA
ncbi:MAG TPA: DUF2306 domain-containing protein [Gemmatimonadaceae bacterium]|nr:DUF2306 domain-containing protein [Gemmatimonadaceae bacterium]